LTKWLKKEKCLIKIEMKNLTMLESVHGDTCRLGYLKLLCCLGDDFQPYSLEYFSSRLYTLTKDYYKKWSFPSGLSRVGLITEKQGLTISKNYVNLSYEFGVLNRQHQTLGNFGRLYSKTESARTVVNFIQNAEARSINVLILNDFERVLFLKQLLEVDGLPMFYIVKWLSELYERGRNSVSRKEAMVHFMEKDYPKICSELAESTQNYEKRIRFKKEAERAQTTFSKIRMENENKGTWNKSALYAKYRHTVPPRFEWLVDVGLLQKEGKGNYVILPLVRDIYDFISETNVESFKDEIYFHLGRKYLKISDRASRKEIEELLFHCYSKFERAGHLAVDRSLFVNFVAFQMLEIRRKLVKLSEINTVIEDLHRHDPKLVQYHVDLTGKWRFIKIGSKK